MQRLCLPVSGICRGFTRKEGGEKVVYLENERLRKRRQISRDESEGTGSWHIAANNATPACSMNGGAKKGRSEGANNSEEAPDRVEEHTIHI